MARALLRRLDTLDQELLERFYLREEPAEQIQREMRLTETSYRLRKSRAKNQVVRLAAIELRHSPEALRKARLRREQCAEIRRRHEAGESSEVLAREFQVSQQTIRDIARD